MENNKLTFNIYAPFFAGFYESIYENGDMFVDNKEELGEWEKDFVMDFDGYHQNVIEKYADTMSDLKPSWIKSVELVGMNSPKEYNFSTDNCIIKVELTEDWKEQWNKFINEDKEWFKQTIDKEFSSRDGFISFTPSTLTDWRWKMDTDLQENMITAMFGFYITKTLGHSKDFPNELTYELCTPAIEFCTKLKKCPFKDALSIIQECQEYAKENPDNPEYAEDLKLPITDFEKFISTGLFHDAIGKVFNYDKEDNDKPDLNGVIRVLTEY